MALTWIFLFEIPRWDKFVTLTNGWFYVEIDFI